MGLLERIDDNFVSDIQNPAIRKKTLKELRFTRSFFLFLVVIQLILLAISMSYQSSITWTFGVMLAILLSTFGFIDARIKTIKLVLSMQQKSNDSNTSKTD